MTRGMRTQSPKRKQTSKRKTVMSSFSLKSNRPLDVFPMPSANPSLTKRIGGLCAALALAACVTGSLNAANVLFNPNLDQTSVSDQVNPTPTGWHTEANKTLFG